MPPDLSGSTPPAGSTPPPADPASPGGPAPAPRQLSDRYVDGVVALDPIVATRLGLPEGIDRLPDLSPRGEQAKAQLRQDILAALAATEATGQYAADERERRCARLLRERLSATESLHGAGEGLRAVGTLFSPVQTVRMAFLEMPAKDAEDWRAIAARLARVPEALAGYRESLAEGSARGLLAGPRQVRAVIAQLGEWLNGAAPGGGRPWFATFAAAGPQQQRAALDAGAAAADRAVAELRDWLEGSYLPVAAERGSDTVGRERYSRWARYWTGSELDLDEVYAWGWQEYARIDEQLRAEAARVLPGATPREAMAHLERHGEAVEGVEQIRERLQQMLDVAVERLDGVHFDLAGPVRRVEAMIAPEGSAAAPYYTRPSLDFSRPGRTWLPTLGRTRFPLWDLVSTWYHEGVPGHHLQLAQWVYVAPQLSRYQTSLGSVGANVEGWALYAERLMDELGFLVDPGQRMGYLDAQQLRAVRVVIDLGMHLQLPIPAEVPGGGAQPFHPGERWTPELAREFFGRNSGRPADFLDSELIRYLGMPGQAISYKLGERAWLAGRSAAQQARAARGEPFDAKAWHMAALSQGALGLDDLVDELSRL